jgi:hypothetical protein
MSKAVTAVYKDRDTARLAIDRLLEAGFSRDDISALTADPSLPGRQFGVDTRSKAPEGAAVGAATGGVLGAAAATLVAIGAIAIPGLGLVAAGPVMAALAGAGAGGAAGGIIGAIAGMGVPEHEARMFADEIKAGGVLVGVNAHDDRVDLARRCLGIGGAQHVHA